MLSSFSISWSLSSSLEHLSLCLFFIQYQSLGWSFSKFTAIIAFPAAKFHFWWRVCYWQAVGLKVDFHWMRSFRLYFKCWYVELFPLSCNQTFSWAPRGRKFQWSLCSFVLFGCTTQTIRRFRQGRLVNRCSNCFIFHIEPSKSPIFLDWFPFGSQSLDALAYLLRLLMSHLTFKCACLFISYLLRFSSRCRSIDFFSISQ